MSLPAHSPNTNRICKSTAINKPTRLLALFLILTGLLTGCTSVRPIVKIGLIAPFEGLYRESGYAALTAMRQAIAECTPTGVDVIPLALDDSGDPIQAQRAAQKLLADPTVQAIVGPLLLDSIPAVTEVMSQSTAIPWLIPPLVAPEGGFASPQSHDWLTTQVGYIANSTPATRLLLLGLPAEWQLQVSASIPVIQIDDLESALATLEAGDAILWLGRPDVGARWLDALRLQQPDVDFWLTVQTGIDIFVAHATDLRATHSLLWRDVNYNQWSQTTPPTTQPDDQPGDMISYLTYRATCVALDSLDEGPTAITPAWQLQSKPIERPESE